MSRAALIIGALLSLALSGCGCSIDSAVNPPKGMRCTSAHDQYHDGGTTLVCDTYSPMPGGER